MTVTGLCLFRDRVAVDWLSVRALPAGKVGGSDRQLKRASNMSSDDTFDSDKAFRQAGRKCFVRVCKATPMYVACSDDYLFGACGDHLTNAIRECAYQYNPPAESVEVFWRPL